MMYEWEVRKIYRTELERRKDCASQLRTLIYNKTNVLSSKGHISGTRQSEKIKTELEELSSDLNELVNLFYD
ncbi:MAG: hypothetical protein ACRCUP_05585 [Mycoplasmatales bacterium]